jgi:hypothetical protein
MSMAADQKLILVKEGEGWMVTEPGSYPASDDEVRSLFTNLADLRGESKVADALTEPARFGLEVPQKAIRFAAGEKELAALKVGRPTEVGSSVYLQKEGDPALYAVASYKVERYRPDPSLFRERLVVKFEATDVE